MDDLQKRVKKGQRIKERRVFCGFSQLELGNKVGVKFTTISKYESGDIKSIDSDMLSLIADITYTNIEYFLLKTDNPEKTITDMSNISMRIASSTRNMIDLGKIDKSTAELIHMAYQNAIKNSNQSASNE
jgi:transcriptional regulator with XRE-family HTH domain